MLNDRDGVDGLRANGVRSEVGFEVMLGKIVKADGVSADSSLIRTCRPSLSTSRHASFSFGKSRMSPMGTVCSDLANSNP